MLVSTKLAGLRLRRWEARNLLARVCQSHFLRLFTANDGLARSHPECLFVA